MLFFICSDFGMTGADVRVGNYRYLLNQQTLFNFTFIVTSFSINTTLNAIFPPIRKKEAPVGASDFGIKPCFSRSKQIT